MTEKEKALDSLKMLRAKLMMQDDTISLVTKLSEIASKTGLSAPILACSYFMDMLETSVIAAAECGVGTRLVAWAKAIEAKIPDCEKEDEC